MAPFPDRPFLTAPFDTTGGGIDFLGMRQVNLSVFLEQLIPGVNNVAGDFGNFCIGAWIPWKFRRLATKSTYTPAAYRRFREAVEVAVAFTSRDGSPADERFGRPRPWARIGANSEPQFTAPLTFAGCRPKRKTSLYDAAQLGPSLRYLALLEPSGALTASGAASGIAVACEDADSTVIAEAVDAALSVSPHSAALFSQRPPEMTADQLDDLGLHGLHPGYHRGLGTEVKRAFLRKLFAPDQPGDARRRTAALILATAALTPVEDVEDLRRCWYTGLLPSGERLMLDDPALAEHRWKWAVFHARQIQRTAVEVLLRCFELAIAAGCRTVPAVVDHWQDRGPTAADGVFDGTLGELVRGEAGASPTADLLATARKWGNQIHGDHPAYDDEDEGDEDGELLRALRLVARWWLRTTPWEADGVLPGWFREGGGAKVGMGWFRDWLAARWERRVADVVRDAFADLVFAQHIKVALTRFDGKLQRLRFTLGDGGIVRCAEVPADKFGGRPSRMVDRLGAFTRLLTDLGVVRCDADERLVAGPLASVASDRHRE